jgi:hypothetical protein
MWSLDIDGDSFTPPPPPLVDLIRHSVAQSSRELLSYLVEIDVLSDLLDILYVEPKDD